MRVDLYDESFPHGSWRGYEDGCRQDATCPMFGTSTMTCRRAHIARSADFGLRREYGERDPIPARPDPARDRAAHNQIARVPLGRLDEQFRIDRAEVEAAQRRARSLQESPAPQRPRPRPTPPARPIPVPKPVVEETVMPEKTVTSHGQHGYGQGCRCDVCRAAKSAANHAARIRKIERDRAAAQADDARIDQAAEKLTAPTTEETTMPTISDPTRPAVWEVQGIDPNGVIGTTAIYEASGETEARAAFRIEHPGWKIDTATPYRGPMPEPLSRPATPADVPDVPSPELVEAVAETLDEQREPWTFTLPDDRELSLSEILGQALGGASTCWIGGTGDRVFDSRRAADILHKTEEQIALLVPKPPVESGVRDDVRVWNDALATIHHRVRSVADWGIQPTPSVIEDLVRGLQR